MTPRIVVIGGGSNQWAPKLVVDFANMPSLQGAEVVLEDINPANLPRMARYVEHCARVRDIPMTVRTTTDQSEALEGADFVVTTISTGGFRSMRHDLEIPARYGILQTVGDSVGPGGIMRGLRNIPVLVGIARDMEELCPDAWLLNITNPMTTLCRAVTRETSIRTVGLCHEVTMISFFLSLLLDVSFLEVDPVITGVNHLPIVTALDAGGRDGLAGLRELLESPARWDEPLPFDLPEGLGLPAPKHAGKWTKGDLIEANKVKFSIFRRCGALPAAGDRHVVEFFPGFLTDSTFPDRWNVQLTSIEEREAWEARYSDELDAMLAADTVTSMPSGDNVAAIADSLLGGLPRNLTVNIPNAGQAPDLPFDAMVETVCVCDAQGVRGRDVAAAPPVLADYLRRVCTSQELVVDAAVRGDRDTVFAAMLADPLASRADFGDLERMTDELLHATAEWLPQFG